MHRQLDDAIAVKEVVIPYFRSGQLHYLWKPVFHFDSCPRFSGKRSAFEDFKSPILVGIDTSFFITMVIMTNQTFQNEDGST